MTPALIKTLGTAGLRLVRICDHDRIIVAPQEKITPGLRMLMLRHKNVIINMVRGDVTRKGVLAKKGSQGSFSSLAGCSGEKTCSQNPSPVTQLVHQEYRASGDDCPRCGNRLFLADYTVGGWTCEVCQANVPTIGGERGPEFLHGIRPAGCQGCKRAEVLPFVGPGCIHGKDWRGFVAMVECPLPAHRKEEPVLSSPTKNSDQAVMKRAFAVGFPWLRNHLDTLLAAGWTRRELFGRGRYRWPMGDWGVAWLSSWGEAAKVPSIGCHGEIVFSFTSSTGFQAQHTAWPRKWLVR